TIAVGSLLHGDRGRSEAPQIPSGSPANLGRDLSGMHPVSFAVTAELVTRNNAKDLPLRPVEEMRKAKVLDGRDRVQCTSCHDPHDDSNRQASGIPFYRRPDFSEVCALCHRF
ncbi:MAG: hypothetical protein HY906_06835, partial [Deltaproteobacteria bacterium]|nr:hypothetical protein [Deltaproteobacteria bacterium]